MSWTSCDCESPGELAAAIDRCQGEWEQQTAALAPTDRARAETAVARAYSEIGLAVPTRMRWSASPYALVLDAHEGLAGERPVRLGDRLDQVNRDGHRTLYERAHCLSAECPWRTAFSVVTQSFPHDFAAAIAEAVWADVRAQLGVGPPQEGPGGHPAWDFVRGQIWDGRYDYLHLDSESVWSEWFVVTGLYDLLAPLECLAAAGCIDPRDQRSGLQELAWSAYWWVCGDKTALLCERPNTICLDEQGRLHCHDGPAIAWPDGYAIYAWHGLPVPAELIQRPIAELDYTVVDTEPNAEFRRVLCERVGYERLLEEGNAQLVCRDTTGTLWRLWLGWPERHSIMVVEGENATIEPDGSRRRYFLRVPPQMQSAHEAVAWTFGVDADQYALMAES